MLVFVCGLQVSWAGIKEPLQHPTSCEYLFLGSGLTGPQFLVSESLPQFPTDQPLKQLPPSAA